MTKHWLHLCFFLDPNVGHTYAFWIRMLATPMLLSGFECWPHPYHWIRILVMPVPLPGYECLSCLYLFLDPNIGHACISAWIRMFVMPLPLPGSECWSCLYLCLDPNVGHACTSAWIRMLVMPVPLPGSEWWSCLYLCLDLNDGHACASARMPVQNFKEGTKDQLGDGRNSVSSELSQNGEWWTANLMNILEKYWEGQLKMS